MPLSFQNLYTAQAYVALLWYDPGCGGQNPWRKTGWFVVPAGNTVEIVGDDLRTLQDPNFAWFADTGADGPCWSGDRWYRVPHNAAFGQCYDDDTGCDALWPFRAATLDTDWLGFTIMLLAPGSANQERQGCTWGSIQFPPEPRTATVPDVVGFEAWQARSTLTSAGFGNHMTYDGDPLTNKEQDARVQTENPPGNSVQPLGITVNCDCSY